MLRALSVFLITGDFVINHILPVELQSSCRRWKLQGSHSHGPLFFHDSCSKLHGRHSGAPPPKMIPPIPHPEGPLEAHGRDAGLLTKTLLKISSKELLSPSQTYPQFIKHCHRHVRWFTLVG